MTMFFRNWLEEGFYEEDGYGDLTRIDDNDYIKIIEAHKEGRLYENDGMATTKVNENDDINLKNNE